MTVCRGGKRIFFEVNHPFFEIAYRVYCNECVIHRRDANAAVDVFQSSFELFNNPFMKTDKIITV